MNATAQDLNEQLVAIGLNWHQVTDTDPESVDPPTSDECQIVEEFLKHVPEWYLYFCDITWAITDPGLIARCGGKVVDVYVFNAKLGVHCCELTPSFEMHFIESIPRGENIQFEVEGHEDLDTLLSEMSIDTDVMYIHCFDVTKNKNCQRYDSFGAAEWLECVQDATEDKPAEERAIEKLNEMIRANTPY